VSVSTNQLHTTMKNETIKTYALVANIVAALRLAEAGEKLAFRDSKTHGDYEIRTLSAIYTRNNHYPYQAGGSFRHCYAVTELDPCRAPDGCPELEPWMAYVGLGKDIPESEGQYYMVDSRSQWVGGFNAPFGIQTARRHYAVDVRTAWAQEHFPEHCRIRAYVAPCAIDVAWMAHSKGGAYSFPHLSEHFRAGWKAAMSHAITNRKEILESL